MAALLNRALFQPGDRVLVALSGGADSLTLLHLLVNARKELGLSLAAVHVHHGMRGSEADEDVTTLHRWCGGWNVDLCVVYADVPGLARERRISVEEAGRIARYQAFARVAGELGANRVATAHTADDQVETVLFRLLRGTGTDGLAGIPERRPLSRECPDVEVVRPLLAVWRAEVEAYIHEHGLAPLVDATNFDLSFRRSRIRYELLPVLEEYGPAVKPALLRLSRQAREEGELLDGLARELLTRARVPPVLPRFPWQEASSPPLRTASLADAPAALARRALKIALLEVGVAEPDSALLDRLLGLIGGGSEAENLPGGARALRSGEVLAFERRSAAAMPQEILVALPGVTELPGWRCRLVAREEAPPASPVLPPAEAVLDLASVHPPLRIRTPQPGDRFRPLNGPGTHLLGDQFNARRIPPAERVSWPVLCDQSGIVWVPGVAVSHRVRVTPETRRCWRLALLPAAGGDVV